MKKIFSILAVIFISNFFLIADVFARGGGGGSGGGGGGGGTGGGSGSPIVSVIWLIIVAVIAIVAWYRRKKKIEAAQKIIQAAAQKDGDWDQAKLTERVKEVFERFQRDWSDFNVDAMKDYLSANYHKRMVLEMNVLKNEGRQNRMEDVRIFGVAILEAVDEADDSKDRFVAEINAQASDTLLDTTTSKKLYSDGNAFTEYWEFVHENDVWKLNVIRQATEDAAQSEPAISQFAERNGFFYDPDFGWLMMPNKGAIFRKSNFKTSDINNHVIGYFRNKIVEFYTFIPNTQNNNSFGPNYIVAQAVLPKSYHDILVRRKHWLFNFGPWGLRRIETESNDFERKFCLWADEKDQVNSFELLAPNFMEKVYALPFELNIEVVGNFLYLYAKSRKDISYDQMLEVLSWAFDEMER